MTPPEPHLLKALPHHDGLVAPRHPSSLDRPRLRRRLGTNVLPANDDELRHAQRQIVLLTFSYG